MKRIFATILVVALLLTMAGCADETGNTDPTDTTGSTEPTQPGGEYKVTDVNTITAANNGNARAYYHIFVGSFSDSNGDGVGDLRGIINRFDYLNDGDDNSGLSLGVEGIWLSPIFKSPTYHKYDVTDYYEIDPKFGTMDDLKELIDLCHERNVQIILDLVINHTARNHQWYQEFVAAHKEGNTASPYYDYYTWTEERTAGITWYPIAGTSHYYEGNFSGDMPELNYENPNVRKAMVDVARYYLDLGVDGFRFDAAKYIYYGNEDQNVNFWGWYMAELRSLKPDIYTVAEVWDGDNVTFPYFAATNCFNFTMAQTSGMIAQTAQAGNVNSLTNYVSQYLKTIHAVNPNAMMVTFIANHDTDRAAGFLTVASGQAKVGANLSLLMPGCTFIYYGEEIGMKGSRGGSNTDANRRLAMPWGDGDTVRDPAGSNYNSGQTNGSVADQLPEGSSLFNHYKKLIMLRKAYPAIVYGTYTPLTTDSKLGGFLSSYEGSTVAVLHNTSGSTVTVDLAQLTDVPLTSLEAYVGVGTATLDGTTLTIEGQTSVILK